MWALRQSIKLPATSRIRVKDLIAICDWTKKKNEAGISTQAFPLESRSNYLNTVLNLSNSLSFLLNKQEE